MLLEWLSITSRVRLPRPSCGASMIASQFEPSFSSASPVRTMTRGSVGALGAQRERAADGHRQAVAERAGRDLDAGDEQAVGMAAQPAALHG